MLRVDLSVVTQDRRGTLAPRDSEEDRRWLTWVEKRFREVAGEDGTIDLNEFKNALNMKNTFFGERLFSLFDEDSSGSVELEELLKGLRRLTDGSSVDKLKILFDVYDIDGSGTIDFTELRTVLQNCMEESSLKLDDEALDSLTLALFTEADEDNNGEITFQELLTQLRSHPGILDNLTISAVQWLSPPRKSSVNSKPSIFRYFTRRYMMNNLKLVVFHIVYFTVNVCLFTLSAVRYRFSNGFVVVARGCGMCLNFNCAFVVVLMLRACLTWLRSTEAAQFLPLDHSINIHKMVGWVIGVQSLVHTIAHLGNIYLVVEESHALVTTATVRPLEYWEYLFTLRSGVGWIGPGFAYISGVILDIVLLVMIVCSLPFIRRNGYFQVFYWTHILYVAFWVFLILHGPIFGYFFVVPGLIFIAENIQRTKCVKLAKYGHMWVKYVHLLPSKVTHLVISRDGRFGFQPGDYIFLKIPAVTRHEWHPFTISSAPELDDVMWVHIRSVGNWTTKLYNYFDDLLQSELTDVHTVRARRVRRNQVGSSISLTKYTARTDVDMVPRERKVNFPLKKKEGEVMIEVLLDGPYGTPTRNIFNSTHAVLIGSGIGVTPFASILQSIMLRYKASKVTCPSCATSWLTSDTNPRKVDFIWINRDQNSFEWFVRLLAQLELQQQMLLEDADDPFLELQLYMTAAASRHDIQGLGLQMAMEIMHQKEKRDVITGLKTRTQAGRPDWKQIFQKIKDKNSGRVNVFFCGAPALAKILSEKCHLFGFRFYKEHF